MSSSELLSEIATVEGTLGMAFKQAGPSYDMARVTVIDGDATAKTQMIRTLNDRLAELRGAWNGRPADGKKRIMPEGGGQSEAKSLGDLLFDSGALVARHVDTEITAFEAKTLFETGAGWAPENARSGRIALDATREPAFAEVLPVVGTEGSAYPYMVETFANAAEEALEAGAYSEATLSLAEVEEVARKIAVFLPVTDEQLADVPGARAYLSDRLGFMLRQRLDGQLVTGDGTPPNISGFLERAGINTQAIGSDSVFEALHKGANKVRTVGFAEPDAIVMNPANWETARLTTTADGIFIMGSPSDSGPQTLFGKRVILTTAMPANKALVGAFAQHSALVIRSGIDVKVSDSHSDFFVKGKQAIRASMRAGLAVFRESAFTEVTLA